MNTNETLTVKTQDKNGERAVYLSIPDAKYKPNRYIGYIKNRTFFTIRNKTNQKFQSLDAIGINYKLLSQGAELFDFIVIQYGLDILQTSREYILNKGYFLHFQKNGLERQIFLKISGFGLDKVNQFDNEKLTRLNTEINRFAKCIDEYSRSVQGNLFENNKRESA
jgi:hypothetical protein